MNRRDFIKSLIAAGTVAIVPQSLVAQPKNVLSGVIEYQRFSGITEPFYIEPGTVIRYCEFLTESGYEGPILVLDSVEDYEIRDNTFQVRSDAQLRDAFANGKDGDKFLLSPRQYSYTGVGNYDARYFTPGWWTKA